MCVSSLRPSHAIFAVLKKGAMLIFQPIHTFLELCVSALHRGSTVNETNCNKKEKDLGHFIVLIFVMSSTSFWTCPSPTRNRLRKNAISCIAVEILVLQFLSLIHDGDGF